MKPMLWLRLGAAVAALIVLGLFALFVPAVLWSAALVAAAVACALSILLPTVMPLPLGRSRSGSDAAAIWAFGPVGSQHIFLGALALAATFLALHQLDALAWAAELVWLGVIFIGWFMLRGASEIVVAAAAHTRSALDDPRTGWQAVMRKLAALTDDGSIQAMLVDLEERFRFAANESVGSLSPETSAIGEQLAQLESSIGNVSEAQKVARQIKVLLEERESGLRAGRAAA